MSDSLSCPCGGGIEVCVVVLGRIPAYGACVWCGAGFLVSKVNGETIVEKNPRG